MASRDPRAAEPGPVGVLNHPVFGPLIWDEDCEYWHGSECPPPGEQLDVFIEPHEEDRFAFVERATELFRWAVANERRILRQAVKEELLEMYNGCWRGDDPKLTARQLIEELEWHCVTLSGSDISVEFTYGPGGLFGGHCVFIEVDDELQYHDVELRG